jgi:hypothetical protein
MTHFSPIYSKMRKKARKSNILKRKFLMNLCEYKFIHLKAKTLKICTYDVALVLDFFPDTLIGNTLTHVGSQ